MSRSISEALSDDAFHGAFGAFHIVYAAGATKAGLAWHQVNAWPPRPASLELLATPDWASYIN